MADVFTVVFVILGFWLALPALCLVLRSAKPQLVERAKQNVSTRPWRSALVGLTTVIPAGIFAGVVASLPGAAKPIGLIMFAGLFLYSFVGIAGLVTHVGQRLASPSDLERPWLQTLRGAVCLVMPATIPVLGWFIICPVTFVMGAGATTLAVFNRPQPTSVAPLQAPTEEPETAAVGASS